MNDLGIGKIIVTIQERDAIHVACVPGVFETTVIPGDPVKLLSRDKDGFGRMLFERARRDDPEVIGVVDPFLPSTVRAGIGVWIFLTPGSATGLRHDYRHPVLDGKEVE